MGSGRIGGNYAARPWNFEIEKVQRVKAKKKGVGAKGCKVQEAGGLDP